MNQPRLFEDGSETPEPPATAVSLPMRLGHAEITASDSRSILTRASGFMADYDFTLNPYSGCSFACSYCYAAFFSRQVELQRTWGQWVQAKVKADETLTRMRTDLAGKRVYMSSVTDPYQPIERKLQLVRGLLPILSKKGVRLVVQTRSPLVVRDLDLLRQFDHVRVNMTVTTDSEDVRRAFEPKCPTNSRRLAAIAKVSEAGIPASITMTPLLPIRDVGSFADRLLATGVKHFVVQPFHAERGRFVAGTGDAARRLVNEMGWNDASYRSAVDRLRARLVDLDEGREGFAPE